MSMGTDTEIASDYITKPYDLDKILSELDRTLVLVDKKRKAQAGTITNESLQSINSMERQLAELAARVDRIDRKLPGFIEELGLEVIRTVIIGFLILVALYFGLGNFLAEILKKLQ